MSFADEVAGGACTTGYTAGPNASGEILKCVGSMWQVVSGGSVTTDRMISGTASLVISSNSPSLAMGGMQVLYNPDATYAGSLFVGNGGRFLNHTSGTEAYYNTGLGKSTLYSNTTGTYNTASGMNALYSNTTGNYNTANGVQALLSNTTGSQNTANGVATLYSNTTGNYNTANGTNALYSNTTGTQNTASGVATLYYNTTGYYNTASGMNALLSNTTGNYNTASGVNAGRYIANGSDGNATANNSVYLGYNTKALADGGTNEIVIGYNATGLGSNSVVLGNSSVATTALRGNVGIGTTTPTQALDVNGKVAVGGGVAIYNAGATYTGSMFFGDGGGSLSHSSGIEGFNNTGVGKGALSANTSGFNNSASGAYALYSNTTGYYNTASGATALYSNTTGYFNVASGMNALRFNTSGFNNSASGAYALYANTTGYYNTANGVAALYSNITGYYNLASGLSAGRYIADGVSSNTTPINSVYLGAETKALADGGTNEIVIGYNATGLGSNSVVLGNSSVATTALRGKVGIGTTSPLGALHVSTASGGTTQIYLTDSTQGANLKTWELRNSGTKFHIMSSNDDGTSHAIALVADHEGNVGIGTASPTVKLDVIGTISATNVKIAGTATLGKYASQPVACGAGYDGMVALTSQYTTCACKGGSSTWVKTSDGTTACAW